MIVKALAFPMTRSCAVLVLSRDLLGRSRYRMTCLQSTAWSVYLGGELQGYRSPQGTLKALRMAALQVVDPELDAENRPLQFVLPHGVRLRPGISLSVALALDKEVRSHMETVSYSCRCALHAPW